ncbi:hypothetical protein Hypma_009841 [Hypsizygus marmoreus]|uniref:Uncharacterized protein n=1 Tax=Hypsizygus marmoreus TaxID=39966 RepID=A0A369JRA0_HYPMA|nr:hypothetical protein Hypma_009841 [Hypsizygus marmoreus]
MRPYPRRVFNGVLKLSTIVYILDGNYKTLHLIPVRKDVFRMWARHFYMPHPTAQHDGEMDKPGEAYDDVTEDVDDVSVSSKRGCKRGGEESPAPMDMNTDLNYISHGYHEHLYPPRPPRIPPSLTTASSPHLSPRLPNPQCR